MLDERPSDAVRGIRTIPETPSQNGGANGATGGRALEAMVARLDDLERRLAEIEAADAARRSQG